MIRSSSVDNESWSKVLKIRVSQKVEIEKVCSFLMIDTLSVAYTCCNGSS